MRKSQILLLGYFACDLDITHTNTSFGIQWDLIKHKKARSSGRDSALHELRGTSEKHLERCAVANTLHAVRGLGGQTPRSLKSKPTIAKTWKDMEPHVAACKQLPTQIILSSHITIVHLQWDTIKIVKMRPSFLVRTTKTPIKLWQDESLYAHQFLRCERIMPRTYSIDNHHSLRVTVSQLQSRLCIRYHNFNSCMWHRKLVKTRAKTMASPRISIQA